jgi:hypothetical protein
MKTCSYCGRENDEHATHCLECATEFVEVTSPPQATEPGPTRPKYKILPLSPEQAKLDLVTIVNCETLFEADVVVSELEATGITAVIPDEFVAEAFAYGLNALGYVRVQVAPKDYEAAKDVIEDADRRAAAPTTPD